MCCGKFLQWVFCQNQLCCWIRNECGWHLLIKIKYLWWQLTRWVLISGQANDGSTTMDGDQWTAYRDQTVERYEPRDLYFCNWQWLHRHFLNNRISLDIWGHQQQVLIPFATFATFVMLETVSSWWLSFGDVILIGHSNWSSIGYPSLANSMFFRTGPKSTNRIIFLFFEFCDLSL